MIKSLILFDCGVLAISESMAIPRLIKLLDVTSGELQGIARQSALILFSMARYPQPCRQMVTEGVFLALSRLLSQSIGDDGLSVIIARTIRECARQQRDMNYDTTDDQIATFQAVLQPLIKLLDSKNPDVLTAVVGAINEVLKAGGRKVAEGMQDSAAVVQRLCRFSPRDTPPLAFRKIASIIGRITISGQFDNLDIGQFIQETLSSLKDHRSSESQVAASRALCKLVRNDDLVLRFGDTAVLPSLVPLVSGDCEELFILAAMATPKWVYKYGDERAQPPTYFNISTVRHLIRLLSHKKDWVVACAARGIRNATKHLDQDELLIFDELIDSGGLRRLIGLISSQDMDTASVAARAIKSLVDHKIEIGELSGLVMLIWEGVIQTLVPYLAPSFDFHPMRETVLKALWSLSCIQGAEEALLRAGAIPYVIRLLDSGNGCPGKVLTIALDLVFTDASHAAQSALVDAGVAQPLIQCLRALPLQERHIDAVLSLARHSYESCLALRAAGVEGVLADYLANSVYRREEISLVIQLLRGTVTLHRVTPTTNADVALFRQHLCSLTSDDQREVERAASAIGKIARELPLIELVDIGGPLNHLLHSQNLDAVLSAAKLMVPLLRRTSDYRWMGMFPIWEDIVPALVPYLAPNFDFPAVRHAILKALDSLLHVHGASEALVQAGAIPHFVRLVTSEGSDKDILFDIFETLSSKSHAARSALVDAGIVQPLIQLVCSGQLKKRYSISSTIIHLIRHSPETCLAFRAAGVEDVLTNDRPSTQWHKNVILNASRLLRSDVGGRRGH
jgi:hypothetical protein